ncbi:unnamed protein product [Hydatigera taeniaeformis]|uniref:Reverse transcriptase domain-containing protein n=1 Tax=Hydatigena taeniaeformis TaxID=6205 RepID=A0A0R3WP58_HYDTA|nr:unnamed protein product [Hydatigera taeniaeformis]
MDARLQSRIRMVMRDPSMKNQRDIMKLMSAMLQQSEKVRSRVNRRLNALGLSDNSESQCLPADISSFVRVVNRPSFIKPHEWARLTGKTGLASFRFGNSTLCHRGERGALGSLIHADATAELSHKMVVNYDLAHVFNRYSLFQLTELFGGT